MMEYTLKRLRCFLTWLSFFNGWERKTIALRLVSTSWLFQNIKHLLCLKHVSFWNSRHSFKLSLTLSHIFEYECVEVILPFRFMLQSMLKYSTNQLINELQTSCPIFTFWHPNTHLNGFKCEVSQCEVKAWRHTNTRMNTGCFWWNMNVAWTKPPKNSWC